MSMESFNQATDHQDSKEGREEVESLLGQIRAVYEQHPFGKNTILAMGLLASLAGKGEAAESADVSGMLSPDEFAEQVAELKEYPEIVAVAEQVYAYHEAQKQKTSSADWSGHSLGQTVYGKEITSLTHEYAAFPETGSGVFNAASVNKDATASRMGQESEWISYAGLSQHYWVEPVEAGSIVPSGETYTLTVELPDGSEGYTKDSLDTQDLVQAIAAKLAFEKGQEISGEKNFRTEAQATMDTDSESEYQKSEDMQSIITRTQTAPIANWTVKEEVTDENITSYTVTIELGTLVQAEGQE